MKNIQWPLFFLLMTQFFISSCAKKWLNAKSDASIASPSTLSDFQEMLDNLSVMNPAPFVGEIAADGHYITDAVYTARQKSPITDAYIWSKTTNHSSVYTWAGQYKKLLYANVVIDGLMDYESALSNESEYNNILGQAFFQRARIFFDLAQLYALPYSPANLEKPFGIVLRKKSSVIIPSVRSTIAETYRSITDDLVQAKSLLPDFPAAKTRGSKVAALALLSRVYLCMMEYEKAFAYSNDALKIYSELIDYNNISVTANFIGRLNAEVIFHAGMSDPLITTSCLIDRNLFDLYADGDLRKSRFFKQNPNGTISFKGNYESLTSTLFCGLATDELYLTRAECLARMNRVQEAMNDLDTLLKSRWDNATEYQPMSAGTQEEAISIILQERVKELILRNTRWTDLRRLNQDEKYAVTLKRTVDGQEYILEPNSYRYTFPIPEDIIEDVGIAQNPEWQ